MHRRAAVRQYIVTTVTGLPTTGVNVTAGRVNPEQIGALPSLNVVTGEEAVAEDERVFGVAAGEPWPQTRVCEFTVEARVAVAADGALDDALDAIALEVEQALGADVTGAGAAHKIDYIGSDASELTGEMDHPVGLRALNFTATYRVNARDPQNLEN